MSDKIIKFKFYDGKTSGYEFTKDYRDMGFEYNVDKNRICGNLLNYIDPDNKLRKETTYFRSNGKNSIITRISKINLEVLIPVLRWKLEQLDIKAEVSYTYPEYALVINFPDESEYSIFMFRFVDIFGEKE